MNYSVFLIGYLRDTLKLNLLFMYSLIHPTNIYLVRDSTVHGSDIKINII